MKWVIQNKVFDNQKSLVKELKQLNVDYMLFDSGVDQIYPTPPTFLYGCVELIDSFGYVSSNEFLAHLPNYAVQEYSKYFGKHYINHGYITTTLNEIVENQAYYRDLFGKYVFIKPNSGKDFTGTEFDLKYLESEDFYKTHPNLEIIVAPCKHIYCEWRLIVIDNEIVTGCQYKDDDGINIEGGVPRDILLYAQSVLKEVAWRPDRAFVLDIFQCDRQRYVGEINAINCSDFYLCNIAAIIKALEVK